MKKIKITFPNADGQELAAHLDMPEDNPPIGYAIFAHCFTCNRNFTAVRNITRALANSGIAVLVFDFTGLGESEGEFADTNFSSNVEDLISAAQFLEKRYDSPKILIGHSLGGAAVVFASLHLPSVTAVATIGAPSSPKHVSHLLRSGIDEIQKNGEAKIMIGGRVFNIQKQFLEDINEQNMDESLKHLDRALLVMHSPQDNVVGIENAAQIYRFAKHPKSYISLDGADHLLSNKADSSYVGQMIATWAGRYI